MSEQEKIDLQKLSQRELLIVTYQKVKELAESNCNVIERQEKHEVRLSVVETKVKTMAAIYGAIGAGLMQVIISFIKS